MYLLIFSTYNNKLFHLFAATMLGYKTSNHHGSPSVVSSQSIEPPTPGWCRALHPCCIYLIPCLMSITWCSWRAASISISSFSRASLMLRSTCSCCCFSISIKAFQRMAYSYSKLPGCANRGGCSRSLSNNEELVNASREQGGTKKTVCQMQ